MRRSRQASGLMSMNARNIGNVAIEHRHMMTQAIIMTQSLNDMHHSIFSSWFIYLAATKCPQLRCVFQEGRQKDKQESEYTSPSLLFTWKKSQVFEDHCDTKPGGRYFLGLRYSYWNCCCLKSQANLLTPRHFTRWILSTDDKQGDSSCRCTDAHKGTMGSVPGWPITGATGVTQVYGFHADWT